MRCEIFRFAVRYLNLFVFLVLILGCSEEKKPSRNGPVPPPVKMIVDLAQLADKSQDEVRALLGEPDQTMTEKFDGKQRPKWLYQISSAELDLLFLNGAVGSATVTGFQLPYQHQSIAAFGFTPRSPTFSNEYVLRFSPLGGYRECSFFNDQTSNIWMAHCKDYK